MLLQGSRFTRKHLRSQAETFGGIREIGTCLCRQAAASVRAADFLSGFESPDTGSLLPWQKYLSGDSVVCSSQITSRSSP